MKVSSTLQKQPQGPSAKKPFLTDVTLAAKTEKIKARSSGVMKNLIQFLPFCFSSSSASSRNVLEELRGERSDLRRPRQSVSSPWFPGASEVLGQRSIHMGVDGRWVLAGTLDSGRTGHVAGPPL